MNTTHPQEIPSEQYHPGFHLAPDFALPRITVRKRLAIIASQGAGKSYLSMVMVERMVEDGHPVVVIDPLGVYWGLRSSADGTGPGLPILILGGPRGDLPLDATAGRLVADLLVEVRRPVILDLSKFANGRQACLFVADLLTGLRRYEKPKLHVVIDEADQFAPQMPKSPEAQLSYDAMDNLARRDRVKGLGATFITQRPAAIAKDVISQVEALISLRLGGPQDIKALNTWFELHATPEQLAHYKSTVLTLPTGTAWVWSPAWLKVFRQVHVQGRTTFDSSATPDVDEEETRPAHLATINLAELSERMKMLAERTSDNPEQLKARIAQLEAALRQAQSSPRRMSSSGRERQDREPSLPSQVASQQVEQLRSQLTQVTQEKERLVHENLLLREQVAVLGARGTEDASKAQVLVTLPPSLPIAEAIVEHVHLGQHAQDTLLLPPLASADLAAQLEQFQDRLVDQERELEQKNALIHQLRAEIERLQDQQPQGQNEGKGRVQGDEHASPAGLLFSEQKLLNKLIKQVENLSASEKALFTWLIEHDTVEMSSKQLADAVSQDIGVTWARQTPALIKLPFIVRWGTRPFFYKATVADYCQRHFDSIADCGVIIQQLVKAAQ